jgi:hypothetical protein
MHRDSANYTREEGKVTIDKIPPKGKHFGKNTGEYVDYEEIK